MDKLRRYYKPIVAGLGFSLFGYLMYTFYKKYKKSLTSNDPLPLKKEEAMHRSNLIRNLKYTLFLQLKSDSILATKNVYDGAVLIEFDLTKVENLFIDFEGGVKRIVVNSEEIEIKHLNGRIYIPADKLMEQSNKVHITYSNHYSPTANGLRHYIDPDDETPYIYSNFEPFSAHLMFPCFDQPNLKAPIKLFVACPEEWKVISATNKLETLTNLQVVKGREKEINSTIFQIPAIREGFSLHEFEVTPALAMYTFAICAGNFAEIEDFSYDKDDKLPKMTLYCRSFIEKAVDAFDIFKTAKETLKWFRDNLINLIPYNKFDLVFVRNFKPVAMENVGCITFDDKFLEPNQTPGETAYFHSIIAHEFAHTWFGNYVTPEWWDDLWLNESFATFLSYLSLKQISENVEKSMENFHIMWLLFSKAKSSAVIFDQYKSTHKIRDTVSDTKHAEIVFDDITYYKGASILKYYYYAVGHELFFKGLKNYIHKYGGKTANYEQFKEILKSLSETREIKPPNEIIEPFLDNVGINRLDSNMKCSLTHIEEFTITQNPCPHATQNKYYNYIVNVLLIYENRENIIYNVEVADSHVSTIKILENVEKPSAVVLNSGDWVYFKQNFDENSRDYLIEHTHRIKDSTTRLVVARDLCEMIKEGFFDPENYIQFAVNLLKNEKESFVVVQVIKTALYIISHFVLFDEQNKLKEILFELIREEIFIKHREIRKTLINFMIDLIDFSNDKQIRHIIYLLKGERDQPSLLRGDSETLENINLIHKLDLSYIDEPTKLRLLETIAESDVLSKEDKKQFEEIISAIEVISSRSMSRTNSAFDIKGVPNQPKNLLTGRKLEQITLEACKPNKSLKEKLWNMFVYKDIQMLNEEYEAYMKGFARKSQMKLLKNYFTKRFFEDFEYVKNYWGEDYAVLFFEHLNPSFIVNDQVLKNFIDLSKTIRINEYKLKNLFERTISQMQLNLKVAKKGKHSPSKKHK